MTREELHELVDIVMDARERTKQDLDITFADSILIINWDTNKIFQFIPGEDYTLYQFTQAVKEYIQGLW